jgi:outer membrane protein
MKHRLRGIVLIAGSLFFSSLYAQEKKMLTLDDAITLGINSSNHIKLSQAKIEEATAALKEAGERKLPNASVTGSYLRVAAGNLDLKNKSNNNGSSSETPNVSQAMYGLLNLSLPIYGGGRIRYGIESSKFLEHAAKLDAENDKEEVIQTTIEAYANLFKAKTAVHLMEENLATSRERGKQLANLEKNGLLPRNDLLKAELQTSTMELNLLDAQNNSQLANVNMDLQLGLPTTTELVLDTTGIEKRDDPRILDDYLQLAVHSRKDRLAMGDKKSAAESDVKVVNAEKYPSIQLTGGYIAADIPKFFSITNAVNAGLGVSYNIASLWKTKAKHQQAEARVKQFVIREALMDDSIRLQVNRNYFALVSSRKKIEVYAKAVEQAHENLRIVKNKFDNSLATTTELLDADVADLQTSLSYTLARADAFVAYHSLLKAAGILSGELKK